MVCWNWLFARWKLKDEGLNRTTAPVLDIVDVVCGQRRYHPEQTIVKADAENEKTDEVLVLRDRCM